MPKTYKAKLNANTIQWLEEKPESISDSDTFIVNIVILNKEKSIKGAKKNDLVDFFKSSPLYGMDLDLSRNTDYGRDIAL